MATKNISRGGNIVKGKGARLKGVNFERKVVRDLKEIDPTTTRVLEYQGGKGFDVYANGLSLKIQCKNAKRPNFLKAIKEASNSVCSTEETPMAVVKVTNIGEFAILHWSDMLYLLKQQNIGE